MVRFPGVVPRRGGAPLESRSGAGVHPVTTADGTPAYLKITPASLGAGALAAARRELRFYRETAAGALVRTPALLDHVDTDDGVALLLAEAGRTIDVRDWTPIMWAALGRDLAALHGMPVPSGPGRHAPDALGAAPDVAMIEAFWGADIRLGDVVRRWDRSRGALPPVLIHGDCHTENITIAGGELTFCDWQAAGAGRATSDLALLSVRATPAGVTVPPGFLDAYLRERPGDLREALVTEELAILVFLWPMYAAFNTPEGNARIRARARELMIR